jgi:anthranilate synthase/aminodeoxychorismate synthase-like glutamine amidotransferase
MKLVIIDNYDSFVYNLKQYLAELGASCQVVRNDSVSVQDIERLGPDGIILSPGPGNPCNARDFGVCRDVLNDLSPGTPTLGVCLGHQGIAAIYGGKVEKGAVPVHGKASLIHHDGRGIFAGLEDPMTVGRYHSLVAVDVPDGNLEVSARSEDGVIMALRHRRFPIDGVQFHPESVLTPSGKRLLANFIASIR